MRRPLLAFFLCVQACGWGVGDEPRSSADLAIDELAPSATVRETDGQWIANAHFYDVGSKVVHKSESDRLYLEIDGRQFDIVGEDVVVPAPTDGVFVFVFERGATKLVSKVRPPEPFEITAPAAGTTWSLANDTSVTVGWSPAAAPGTRVAPFLDALCAQIFANIVGEGVVSSVHREVSLRERKLFDNGAPPCDGTLRLDYDRNAAANRDGDVLAQGFANGARFVAGRRRVVTVRVTP